MDTKSTPRQGYPVEIQALWYNALVKMRELDVANAAERPKWDPQAYRQIVGGTAGQP